ncbi:hypothetical protein IL306_006483 [Fusarium sp. DS 682]|nr:hypothetical protein IL306_006483 [Fusarium sp. DS 682]
MVSDQTASSAQHDTSMEVDQREQSTNATPCEPEAVEFPDELEDAPGDGVNLLDADDDNMPANNIRTQEDAGRSKAKAMEQKHPNMYF